MSWLYTRPLRLNIRMSEETRHQLTAIRRYMSEAEPSDADAVAWAVSLLYRHMTEHSREIDPVYLPEKSTIPLTESPL